MEYVFTFLEGFASFISPCMLPMVPIYISYLIGDDDKKRGKLIFNSIGFIIGFTVAFSILALIANSIGGIANHFLIHIRFVFGFLIIFLGLNYMEIIKIRFLNKTVMANNKIKNINFLKALLFGFVFSLSWTPCVGTFLSAALILIANERDVLRGLLLIIVYSMGLGIPFFISAVFIDKIREMFDFIKRHYNIVKELSGLVLIVMGIYMMIC